MDYDSKFFRNKEYELIREFKIGDMLPNGKVAKKRYFELKHIYCGNIYVVGKEHFIYRGDECQKCCQKYENSFAYHIEVELNEPLEKYWDFEKNTVNPYHISKNSHTKVWIKCTETDYHGSYETTCVVFLRNSRCPYCVNHHGRVHPLDSFAQYHIDNTDKDFLAKYWDYDLNKTIPFELTPHSNKKIWIKCQQKDYHGSYEVRCADFTNGNRCPYCNTFASKKVHPKDSFGYHNFDKVQSWHPDNKISPFRIALKSHKKCKFICPECGNKFEKTISKITNRYEWCPQCNSSKGEKEITKWLRLNNIEFIPQKTYVNLLGLGGKNLSYDFYLPDYNLLIEYQGEHHDGSVPYQTEDQFKYRQEHDRRKREYARTNKIELLEIWYYDFNNIKTIMEKVLYNIEGE